MKNLENIELLDLAEGEVRAWIEQGEAVHLKAVDPHGDPVELTATEVKKLADALLRFYELIRD